MYGMVNKALQDMVSSRQGAAVWEQVCQRAGVHDELFLSNQPYPDELTYRLVGATAEITRWPVPELLAAFGEWWVLDTAAKGYGALMAVTGQSLGEFLHNLDHLHTRVAMIFPQLRPPQLTCTDLTPHSLELHYVSSRAGLTPFVVGLVHGLAKRFSVPVRVELRASREQGADHDILLVDWSAP
jgi:hypothetical protein